MRSAMPGSHEVPAALKHVTVAGFNGAGTNGQVMLQSSGIECIAAVVHLAVRARDGSLFFGSAGRLDVLGQLSDDLCTSPVFEPLLPGSGATARVTVQLLEASAEYDRHDRSRMGSVPDR